MTEEKIHKERHGSWWALSPLLVFLCLYLVTSILVNDFYKVPITVAFLVSSCYAIAITQGRIFLQLRKERLFWPELLHKAPSRWEPLMQPSI